MLIEIILLIVAGIGAGLVTGLFGGSATLVVVPILVVFLNYHPYKAIGLALSIDIFSSVTAYMVYKIKNKFHIKPILPLIIAILIGIIAGSTISINIPSNALAILAGAGILIAGMRFTLPCPNCLKRLSISSKKRKWLSIIWGLVNGIILGVVGGGGGLMLLMTLTIILQYPTHKAVGISVLGMAFIALAGAINHYILMPFSMTGLIVGSVGGIIGAYFTSKIANNLSEKRLNFVIGPTLTILAIVLLIKALFFP
ncbi:MAG: sulfite exporter TauE/SafE family protein [Nanobdellota archaeon]